MHNNDNYDYSGNFIAFLQTNNIIGRVAELVKKKIGIALDDNESDERVIKLFIEKMHIPHGVINNLCTWGAQPEGSVYWSNLHDKWHRVCDKQVVLINKAYKSIW